MQASVPNTKQRLDAVDALRGFAILAIMLLHSIEHFNFYVFPDASLQPAWLTTLDGYIWDTLFFLFGGKGYAIFALLFGLTFSMMYRKQAKAGVDFGGRFFWRLILLVGFAIVNGAFFPGEILSLYAMVGVVLILVRGWSSNFVLLAAFLLLLQPIELWHYVQSLIDPDYVLPVLPTGNLWRMLKEGQLSNSFFDLVKSNTLYGHKVTFYWSLQVGRTVQTAGLFVLGYWLGIKDLFVTSDASIRFWKRMLVVAAIAFIPLYFLGENFAALVSSKVVVGSLGKAITMYQNLSFTFVLVSGFMLLYQYGGFRKLVGGLRYVGRMSLTAYVLQSILGSFVFFGYGLGLGPNVRHTVSLGIGIVLWIIQFYFFKWWINKYGQGPLEKLWHRLTWIQFKKD